MVIRKGKHEFPGEFKKECFQNQHLRIADRLFFSVITKHFPGPTQTCDPAPCCARSEFRLRLAPAHSSFSLGLGGGQVSRAGFAQGFLC